MRASALSFQFCMVVTMLPRNPPKRLADLAAVSKRVQVSAKPAWQFCGR